MKANAVIIPLACFAIGTACGLFFSGRNDTESADTSKKDATEKRSTLGSSLGSQKPSERPVKAKAATTRSAPRSAQLEELLQFANGGSSARDVVELYKLTEHLDPDALIQLANEIEQLPPGDHRAHQLRNAVLGSLARKDPDAALAAASSIALRNARQSGLTAVIHEIALTDLSKAIGSLDEIKDQATLSQVAQALVSSRVEGAPAALSQYLKDHPGLNLQWGLNQMYTHWAREDLPAALASFGELSSSRKRNYALQGIGQSITSENIDTGLEFLETLPASEKGSLLQSIIGKLSTTNPSKALELLETHVASSQRSNVISAISSNWMNSDPEAAKAWMKSLENSREQVAALQNMIWNNSDETEWIATQLASLPMNQQTQNFTSNLAQRWSQRDPAAAAAWVDQLPFGQARDRALQNVMQQWASSDSAAAADYMMNNLGDGPLTNGEARIAGQIASQLVKNDPEAAIAWMDSLGAEQQSKSTMISNMVSQWVLNDPDAAVSYVKGLEGKDREQGISTLMSSWGYMDFDRAETFASEIADPKIRQNAIGTLISNSAHYQPEKAAEALAKATSGLNETEVQEHFANATTNIANGWARLDPVAAATWAVDLPEGSNRPQALQSIVQQWAQFEPKAASEWLTTFESGPDRDSAVTGLVGQIRNSDPEAAFAWAASIDDKDKRIQSIRMTINTWQRADKDATRAAIETSDLSEELRNQLLQSVPK